MSIHDNIKKKNKKNHHQKSNWSSLEGIKKPTHCENW